MTRRRWPWIVLAVWTAWLFALQGWLASSGLGPWAPETGLVLLCIVGERVTRRRALVAALWIACVRIAFSADPPVAILAGYLGVAFAHQLLGSAIALDHPLVRALFSFAALLVLASFLGFARSLELSGLYGLAPESGPVWRSATATAIVALLCGPLAVRLPGLKALWKRRSRPMEATWGRISV